MKTGMVTTIVLIPGAWIKPSFYEPFLNALDTAGYPARHAGYPSLNPSDPLIASCQRDSDALNKMIRPMVDDEGLDILLMMHSYAGMPGASAAAGLAKTERLRQGKAGGVVGMIFMAAFVVPELQTCAGLMGGSLPSWIRLDDPHLGLNLPVNPVADFAADVPHDAAVGLRNSIRPHATLAFNSPQPHPAWADEAFSGRLGYIVTADDAAVPKNAQNGMIASTQKTWIVKEMATSHCAPFITHIGETVSIVTDMLHKFEKN